MKNIFYEKISYNSDTFSSGDIGGVERSLSRLASKGEINEYLLGSLSGDASVLEAKIKI